MFLLCVLLVSLCSRSECFSCEQVPILDHISTDLLGKAAQLAERLSHGHSSPVAAESWVWDPEEISKA